MNRNVESHFAELPAASIQRSIFDLSYGHKTSGNIGDLIPIYVQEVLPGDSFKMKSSKVIRLQTMLTPVMDNLYADFYYFFVPNRLVWTHWKEMMGENTQSAWIQTNTYQVPAISSPLDDNNQPTCFENGTLADYFGLPTYHLIEDEDNPGSYIPEPVTWTASSVNAPSALPFRSYALIADSWFRDQNLTDPLNIPLGDSNQTGSNGSDYINDVANGGKPFRVAKYHDFFTSMLPSAQKSQPVAFGTQATFPGYTFDAALYPVGTTESAITSKEGFGDIALRYVDPDGTSISTGNHRMELGKSSANDFGVAEYVTSSESATAGTLTPINLWTSIPDLEIPELSIGGVSFTINELRLAFQLQKFYEKQARGGSRYTEVILNHFSVRSPDARLQRPEYLGGNRVQVNVHEVTNNAQSEKDFLGDLGAKSHTVDVHFDFEKSFTEHGLIIGLMCLRYDHTYSQGLAPFWLRRKFEQFYWPVFSSLGEFGYRKCSIYADTTTMDSDEIFGFNEAWADYRFAQNRCSAEMRPGVSNSLASWHFADYYTECPTLSDGWIREDKSNVDRTLAVTSSVANQFWCDLYFTTTATRPMPMYSIPGLIDHH